MPTRRPWLLLRRACKASAVPATATAPLPVALGGVVVAAQAAALLLRPRSGLIRADPVALGDHFEAAEVARARAFSRPQLALGLSAAAIEGALLLAAVRRPPRVLRGLLAQASRNPLPGAAATAAGLWTALTLAPLPVRALARRRALAAGLATQGWGDWARDLAKESAIGAALSGAAGTAVVTLMRRQPRWWWLSTAALAGVAAPVATFLAPLLLDPVFNRFDPLPEGETRSDVLELAAAAGVGVGEVFAVDASRRTTAANAYVTGLGASRRVVLFDTLLSQFTRDETRLVVAHELAHVRHRDVQRGLMFGALVAPAAMHAAAALAGRLHGEQSAAQAGPALLPALGLSLGVVGALTQVLACQLSRRTEARADAFSLRLTDASEPFISFERRLVSQNLSDPSPPRALVALLSTHPPTLTRIGIATAYARGVR